MMTKKKEQKLNEEIALLRHQVADLKQIIETQELIKLREENKHLREKEELISKVKFKLRDVTYLQGDEIILVKYEVPPIKIPVDDNGNVTKNDMFYSINKLMLLPLDDMKKISNLIQNVKNMKGEK